MSVLHPVVLSCGELTHNLKGPAMPAALSRLARRALYVSASLSGAPCPFASLKDDQGRPVPSDGWFWSVSHKPGMVAGVVARQPIGVDIEFLKPRSQRIYEYIINEHENSCRPVCFDQWNWFFRVWTAKEAVLKATGLGLAGLSACRVAQYCSETELELTIDGAIVRKSLSKQDRLGDFIAFSESLLSWKVNQICIGLHFGSVTAAQPCQVKWHAIAAPPFLDTP
ncbi:MAG: hypothetical protein CVV64_00410 [Candidatus Wallbacteria bacterium HGW-Wallbacteria-1]|jgi:4'-phosphopantetheinyl transferase|uniref:4'-phosphopantetheinyl transferase domain-containing protein n=1 Tax=Candidatus Wallbacteria bacterium HGW-Wallbacteria-1 TaxID=2013854 RepID=A0A2N1PU93_9BACT|nr:MAG: hypothetical protein CVV64_00410 [Candidatus Wallbacteria bacterium HGW-Wallbacteria-1]